VKPHVYHRIGLTVKSDLQGRDNVVDAVMRILRASNAQVFVDQSRCADLHGLSDCKQLTSKAAVDVMIVIGGDGTILRTVREMRDPSVPILSINRGSIGFLAELQLEEVESDLPALLAGDGIIEERNVLSIEALRKHQTLFSGNVLNEASISQGSIARLMDLRARVNGQELTTFRSDGLIMATPTGSTAYSLAAGGPIVHPKLDAIILSPINSYSFSQKPIVIPGSMEVTVEVLAEHNKFGNLEVSLTLDGQQYISLQREDIVRVRPCAAKVRFLRRKREAFFSALRAKLKWGEGPER